MDYYLLIYNGTGINKSVCGMAGIITAIPNSSGYDKPYLVYNESIINLINNQLSSNGDLSRYNVTIAHQRFHHKRTTILL